MNTSVISKPKKSTSIRIDADVFDRVKSIAEEEHRSFSNYIEYVLLKVLDQEGRKPVVDHTERICQALREVKMMKEGKIKETSMEEFLNDL